MINLIKLKEHLEKTIKARDDWKMKGTDTPYLTYHEQLELYEERIDRLAKQLKKEMSR